MADLSAKGRKNLEKGGCPASVCLKRSRSNVAKCGLKPNPSTKEFSPQARSSKEGCVEGLHGEEGQTSKKG
jgi:hypothetical protein